MATGLDKRLLINSAYVNEISLLAILLCTPGALVSFFEDVLMPEKKRFRGKVTCTECNKVLEIELDEV
jgi:hypothetical protein